jgi:hypothetical protein
MDSVQDSLIDLEQKLKVKKKSTLKFQIEFQGEKKFGYALPKPK